MSFDERHRIRFHRWLVEHGLAPETADAILRSMTPDDWHSLATKNDLAALRGELIGAVEGRLDGVDSRFDGINTRFDAVNNRFEGIDGRLAGLESQFADMRGEMAGIRTDVRTVLLALVGFMLTVLLTAGGIAVGFLVS